MSAAAEDAQGTELAVYQPEVAPGVTATIPFWQRLGVRLTLLMMTLVLLLAVATAVLVIRGFEETQRNALALTRDQLGAQAKTQLLEITRRDAAVLSETLHRAELLSRTAALVVAARGEGGLEPLLGSTPNSYLVGTTLVFVDPQGFVRAYHGAPGAERPALPSSRLLTEAAPDSNPARRSVWTLPNQGPARHALIVSTPVYDGDRFGGVLSVALPRSALDAALADLAPSAASGVILLNDHGDVVAATGGDNALTRLLGARGPALLGEISRSERLQTLGADGTLVESGAADGADGADNRASSVDATDAITLLASATLPRLGWTLAVAAPLGDLAAPPVPIAQGVRREANDTISATLINIIATFLLTLIGATLFSRSFLAEPIGALVAGAHDLAAGRLGVRIPVTTHSELGVLASTFNQMSGRLKARSDELLAANEALKQSESRLELAVRGANDGLWEWDIRADSLYLSPRWLQILGYRPGDLDPSMATLDDLTHPDDRAARQAQLSAHLSGAAPTYQSEHRLRHREGGYRWVLARGASLRDGRLRDGRGEVVRMAGSLTDITDRVEAMALLERRVAERTSELSALLELSNRMAMTLELSPLVELILDTLKTVVDYDAAALWQRRGEVLTLLHDSDPSTPAFHDSAVAPVWPLADAPHLRDVMRERRPISIDNVRDDSPAAHSFRGAYGRAFGELPDHLATWMGVPLIVRDRVIGMLSFEHRDVGYYTPARSRLALAFANEVAIAIESARLYEAAQDKAALEERQHLARELHDSVSQALYGIVLGAHTAQAQLGKIEGDTSAVVAPLDYVTNLAQAGIAEMRALIFELRPESLEQEGLIAALRKQAESLRYRHHLGLELTLTDEPALPLATKQTLYRIAQEALHNVVKHARARQVSIELRHDPERTQLVIGDDGVGFDPTADFPGHLGLVSMRERAEAIGADLHLESSPGHGTRLSVTLVGVRQAVA